MKISQTFFELEWSRFCDRRTDRRPGQKKYVFQPYGGRHNQRFMRLTSIYTFNHFLVDQAINENYIKFFTFSASKDASNFYQYGASGASEVSNTWCAATSIVNMYSGLKASNRKFYYLTGNTHLLFVLQMKMCGQGKFFILFASQFVN